MSTGENNDVKTVDSTIIAKGDLTKTHHLLPDYLYKMLKELTRFQGCMSYNDSYFTEDEGFLKRLTGEIEHWMSHGDQRLAEGQVITVVDTVVGTEFLNGDALNEHLKNKLSTLIAIDGGSITVKYDRENAKWFKCDIDDENRDKIIITNINRFKSVAGHPVPPSFVGIVHLINGITLEMMLEFTKWLNSVRMPLIATGVDAPICHGVALNNFLTSYVTEHFSYERKHTLRNLIVKREGSLALEFNDTVGQWQEKLGDYINPRCVIFKGDDSRVIEVFTCIPNTDINHVKYLRLEEFLDKHSA